MKTVLFIVALLALIGIGAAVLYKIGETIVEIQDATSCGKPARKEHEDGRTGGQADAASDGTSHLEAIVHRCQRSVQQLADLVGDFEKRRIERERQSRPHMRMR